MPTIKRQVQVAAGGSANPLTGSQYEFAQFDALIEAAIVRDSGGGAGVLEANMFSGSDLLLENAPVSSKPLATAPITYPEDFDVVDVIAAGERIGLTLRETGGVAVADAQVIVRITPV